MFYKPKYCCHCGEKIERSEWSLFASRRFCEFCETEQKHHDYVVRGVVLVFVLFGVLGVTGFFGPGPQRPPEAAASKPVPLRAHSEELKPRNVPQPAADARRPADATQPRPSGEELSKQLAKQSKPSEPTYYCGAITKKGTSCSRRVKYKGRCWQHAGRPDPEVDRKDGT